MYWRDHVFNSNIWNNVFRVLSCQACQAFSLAENPQISSLILRHKDIAVIWEKESTPKNAWLGESEFKTNKNYTEVGSSDSDVQKTVRSISKDARSCKTFITTAGFRDAIIPIQGSKSYSIKHCMTSRGAESKGQTTTMRSRWAVSICGHDNYCHYALNETIRLDIPQSDVAQKFCYSCFLSWKLRVRRTMIYQFEICGLTRLAEGANQTWFLGWSGPPIRRRRPEIDLPLNDKLSSVRKLFIKINLCFLSNTFQNHIQSLTECYLYSKANAPVKDVSEGETQRMWYSYRNANRSWNKIRHQYGNQCKGKRAVSWGQRDWQKQWKEYECQSRTEAALWSWGILYLRRRCRNHVGLSRSNREHIPEELKFGVGRRIFSVCFVFADSETWSLLCQLWSKKDQKLLLMLF